MVLYVGAGNLKSSAQMIAKTETQQSSGKWELKSLLLSRDRRAKRRYKPQKREGNL